VVPVAGRFSGRFAVERSLLQELRPALPTGRRCVPCVAGLWQRCPAAQHLNAAMEALEEWLAVRGTLTSLPVVGPRAAARRGMRSLRRTRGLQRHAGWICRPAVSGGECVGGCMRRPRDAV